MEALVWFQRIEALRQEVAELDNQIEEARASAGPHGQWLGSIGGDGGRTDALAGIDRIIDADLVAKRDRMRERLEKQLERATDVLYGKSGRGGLAKARSTTDADILCCHYLQGMGWAQIARDIVRRDTEHPKQWCRMRAVRACAYIDSVGVDKLSES